MITTDQDQILTDIILDTTTILGATQRTTQEIRMGRLGKIRFSVNQNYSHKILTLQKSTLNLFYISNYFTFINIDTIIKQAEPGGEHLLRQLQDQMR